MRLGTKPTIREGNYIYMILGIMLVFIGSYVQSKSYYWGLLISQYIIILLPPLIFLKIKNYSFKENLRLNKTSFKNIILTIFIVIFSYPIAVFFNYIGITFLEKYGRLIENPIIVPETSMELLKSFFVIAVTPGICEEIMFRGFLLSSYENLGKKKAIIYSALLFAIFHFNLQNLLGPMVLGIIFGIIVYKTDSILVSIVGHTTNNTIALLLGYLVNKTNIVDIPNNMEEVVEPNTRLTIISLAVIALLCGVIVASLVKQMDKGKNTGKEKLIEINDDNVLLIREVETVDFTTVLPLLIILAIYLYFTYKVFFRV